MLKIEELEHKILTIVNEFHKENKDIKISYDSNYGSGRITIIVKEDY